MKTYTKIFFAIALATAFIAPQGMFAQFVPQAESNSNQSAGYVPTTETSSNQSGAGAYVPTVETSNNQSAGGGSSVVCGINTPIITATWPATIAVGSTVVVPARITNTEDARCSRTITLYSATGGAHTWVTPSATSFTLTGGESRAFTYTITVPRGVVLGTQNLSLGANNSVSTLVTFSVIPATETSGNQSGPYVPTTETSNNQPGVYTPRVETSGNQSGAPYVPTTETSGNQSGQITNTTPAIPASVSSSGSRSGGRNGGAAICAPITSYLTFGGSNSVAEVTKLQNFLNRFERAGIAVTGVYDTATVNAVRAFQTKYFADTIAPWGPTAQVSGQVYITTLKKINEIMCGTSRALSASERAIVEAYQNGSVAPTVVVGENAPILTPGTPAPVVAPAETATSTEFPIKIENNTQGQSSSLVGNVFGAVGRGIKDFFKWLFGMNN
jgi:hypothetical protein